MSAHTGFFDSNSFHGISPTGLCGMHSPHLDRCRLHMLPPLCDSWRPSVTAGATMPMVLARLLEVGRFQRPSHVISFCEHDEWLQDPNGLGAISSQSWHRTHVDRLYLEMFPLLVTHRW